MAALSLPLCTLNLISASTGHKVLLNRVHHGAVPTTRHNYQKNCSYRSHRRRKSCKFCVLAATEGSASPKEAEERVPSWARPNSDEPPPWARDEGKENESKQSFEIPYYAYLLASAVTAIAAIGSVFEYVNQKPVFGVVNSDSILYGPLLGFFAITGIPTSAFLWFKAVQIANKEAEDQDRRDGFL
ncbi:hypothetical protein Dimus_013711 [Dionaea muscipula]